MAQQDRDLPRLRAARGFQLAELLVVTVTSTVVLGAILVVFNAGRRAYFTTDAKVTVREEARKALERIAQDLADAKLLQACTAATGNTCPNTTAAYLRFRRPTTDAATLYNAATNGPTWEATDVAYRWARGANGAPASLVRCSPANDPVTSTNCRPVAFRVTALQFIPLPNNTTLSPPYSASVSFFQANETTPNVATLPGVVDVTITIAPAVTETSRQVVLPASTMRVLLRNPQR